MSTGRTHRIARAWTHSHEEDSGRRVVFRPADYAFPPGRQPRASLELQPDGRALYLGGPAPADRRSAHAGSWELDGDDLRLRLEGRADKRYEIESVDEQRLVLRRMD